MIIRVRCPAGGDTEEYIMLELQGKVEPTGGALVGCDGQLMGYLSLKDAGLSGAQRADLQVGKHKVSGELKPLKHPYVLLEKKAIEDGGAPSSADDDLAAAVSAAEGSASSSSSRVEYVVRAVVKRVFAFSERPQPIIMASVGRI